MNPNQIKRATPQLALVVLTGTAAGREILLAEGGQLTLGRSQDSDIVIDDAKASRRHTRFLRAGDELYVEDLNSINGTFVNGAKVEKAVLFPGDTVEVVNVRIKVESRSRDAEKSPAPKTEPSAVRAGAFDPTMGNVLSGPLNPAKLREMLNFLKTRRKTGVLIAHAAWGTGRIGLRDGEIRSVSIQDVPALGATKALQRLLRAEKGSLEFNADEPVADGPGITGSLDNLLQTEVGFPEAFARLEKLLRHLDARLEVNSAKAHLDPGPTPAEQAILRIVADHGTLAAVMDRFPGTDTEAVRLLCGLLERGAVRPVR